MKTEKEKLPKCQVRPSFPTDLLEEKGHSRLGHAVEGVAEVGRESGHVVRPEVQGLREVIPLGSQVGLHVVPQHRRQPRHKPF